MLLHKNFGALIFVATKRIALFTNELPNAPVRFPAANDKLTKLRPLRYTDPVRVAVRFFSGVPHPHLLGVCCPNPQRSSNGFQFPQEGVYEKIKRCNSERRLAVLVVGLTCPITHGASTLSEHTPTPPRGTILGPTHIFSPPRSKPNCKSALQQCPPCHRTL